MKNILRDIASATLIIGIALFCVHCYKVGAARKAAIDRLIEGDTVRHVVVYDTIRIVSPEPVTTTQLPAIVRRLPLWRGAANIDTETDTVPVEMDSADVVIPVEQKVYTDSANYRAVISGAFVSLDTMEVYSRREVVTIRHPPDKPKRWSLGVGVGYGMTPHGMQPFVGVTLSYSLWRF